MIKSDITPKVRGECVVAACRNRRLASALVLSHRKSPSLSPSCAVPGCGCILSPVDFGVALQGCCPCLPALPPSAGIRHTSLAAVMMGLLRAFEAHKAPRMCGRKGALRRDSGQARMRQGEGTESHFLHAAPCQSCLATDGTVICHPSR